MRNINQQLQQYYPKNQRLAELANPYPSNPHRPKLFPTEYHSMNFGDLGFMGSLNAAPFSPDDVAGLKMWYDLDDPTTITESANRISQLDDKSTEGNDLVQATGADQPLLVASGQNGKPIMRFDGVTERMTAATITYSQPNTLFMVCTSPSSDGRAMFDGDDASNRNLLNRQVTNTYRVFAGASANGGTASIAIKIFRALYNGTSSELDIDGSSIFTGSDAGTQGLNDVIIASFDGQTGFGNIDVAEILFYNASVSSGDKTSILNYLNNKWAVF